MLVSIPTEITGYLNQLNSWISGYENSSTVVKFTPEKPLDPSLIEKLVLARVHEIDARTK